YGLGFVISGLIPGEPRRGCIGVNFAVERFISIIILGLIISEAFSSRLFIGMFTLFWYLVAYIVISGLIPGEPHRGCIGVNFAVELFLVDFFIDAFTLFWNLVTYGLGFGLVPGEPHCGCIGDQIEIKFASDPAKGFSEESQIPLFYKDLQRIGYPAMELEKIEREDWEQQMDYLCIRIQLCYLNWIMLLQYYYLLGKRLAMYNWNTYAKYEMIDQFVANKFKEDFTSLLEEAWRSYKKEVEFLITNN
ncbi:12165_t:CDS:2, partial [Gigaspora margarita]